MAESWRRRTQFTGKKFRPHTRALGEFALAWNDLHDVLGEFFLYAIRGETKGVGSYLQLWSVWNSITNDRQKRVMLQHAIDGMEVTKNPRLKSLALEVLWLIRRADSLETKRNNVIHSPLIEMANVLAAAFGKNVLGEVVPGGGYGHARSEGLSESVRKSQRTLLQEIRFYRDYTVALTAFARKLDTVWETRRAIPGRPELPSLKD